VFKHPRLIVLVLSIVCTSEACTRGDSLEDLGDQRSSGTSEDGNDAALAKVSAAVRAISQPEPTVDQVAAAMEGAIKVRTKSQALIYYDGYRVIFVTPRDRVTQVTFQLVEAKPSMRQLSDVFGTPIVTDTGVIFEHSSSSTGARLHILAEPVSMPPDDRTLVQRIVVRGARGL